MPNRGSLDSVTMNLTALQLTGREESHLTELPGGHRMQACAAEAFGWLSEDARSAGFELEIASSFRSFERQRLIWNGKASGERAVHDDQGKPLSLASMSDDDKVLAIMRFSALPGTSRHHWGTDIDVFDAAAMPEGYQLQLSPAEVAPDGLFGPLHGWLDERIASDRSHGFFRPYAVDRGGVAPERWHLSYAPQATGCESACTAELLARVVEAEQIELADTVHDMLEGLLQRFVAVPANWCPARYRD